MNKKLIKSWKKPQKKHFKPKGNAKCQQNHQASQTKKAESNNLNFIIDLVNIAIVAEDKEIAEVEPKNFSKALTWSHKGSDMRT